MVECNHDSCIACLQQPISYYYFFAPCRYSVPSRWRGNSLRANEIALQVVGQNIANANTPGYLREEIHLVPGPTQKLGGLLLGTGVHGRFHHPGGG